MKFFISCFLLFTFTIQSIHCGLSQSSEKTEPFVFVVFGATGDLTARKLLPAMYNLANDGNLSDQAIVGIGRREMNDQEFRLKMGEAIDQFSRNKPRDVKQWSELEKRIFYHSANFDDDLGYENLKKLLTKIDGELGTQGNRIFFLAVHPSYFPLIIEKLHAHQLIQKETGNSGPWTRVIIEKPFGSDFDSAVDLQKHLVHHLDESQIYRMDHYLGKEGVQNLLSFRFENPFFEPLWNNRHIDHIQITLGEEIGIGSRANFWEETGALRDVLQNHLMQLLALIAMEQPADLQAAAIQKEKLKLLHSIRHFPSEKIDDYVVRGQYRSGLVKGVKVAGYLEEKGVPSSSAVETYVAAKILIDNPRWEGVPFYIRGGKRLEKQTTEILVVFKKNPSHDESNALLIRIQPNTGIFLKTVAKVPGMKKELMPVVFGYKPDAVFNKSSPEAYERLIFDCAKGDSSLYVNGEEQLAAWRLLTPVLQHWEKDHAKNVQFYEAGTRGPKAADKLLEVNGHNWQLIED